MVLLYFFFFQAEDGIRDYKVTGVQTCALPISPIAPRIAPPPITPSTPCVGKTISPSISTTPATKRKMARVAGVMGQIRNSKTEIRNKHECGKSQTSRLCPRLRFSSFLFFEFVSNFDLRISD